MVHVKLSIVQMILSFENASQLKKTGNILAYYFLPCYTTISVACNVYCACDISACMIFYICV